MLEDFENYMCDVERGNRVLSSEFTTVVDFETQKNKTQTNSGARHLKEGKTQCKIK